MKLLKITSLLCLVGVLGGCVSAPQYVAPQTEEFSVPDLDKVVTASMGEHLVDRGRLTKKTVLELRDPIEGSHQLLPGTYDMQGSDEDKRAFSALVQTGIFRDPVRYVAVYHDKPNELCMISIYNVRGTCYEKDFVVREQTSVGNASYRQTLIYTGRVGDRLRISYREYVNDMARPSFSNEVEYDLSSSNIISYQGAQLEVIEANNVEITYKVLRGFNDI